jgi:predicted transcriptional regulator of viral defense system
MERYNLVAFTKKIYNSRLSFFSLKTLRDILEVKRESSLFLVIKKLLESEILVKIEKDKYMIKGTSIHDFALANFIYQPSYISFESALNFYGILSQFPYEIASATSKKPVEKTFEGKVFAYNHIKRELFWGYQKQDDFLIALPEKALLDQLYLTAKGYKSIGLDEYDLTKINKTRLKVYFKKFPKTRQFESINKTLERCLKI